MDITIVAHSASYANTSPGTATVTLLNVDAGDMILVFAGNSRIGTFNEPFFTVSDDSGNTYIMINRTFTNSGGGSTITAHYAIATSSVPSLTVTTTPNPTNGTNFNATMVVILRTAQAVADNATTNNNGTTDLSVTITTSQLEMILFAAVQDNTTANTPTYTANNDTILDTTTDGAGGSIGGVSAYNGQIYGSITLGVTSNINNNFSAISVGIIATKVAVVAIPPLGSFSMPGRTNVGVIKRVGA